MANIGSLWPREYPYRNRWGHATRLPPVGGGFERITVTRCASEQGGRMGSETNNRYAGLTAAMNRAEFQRLSAFIESEYGIKLPPDKQTMLEARLRKRLRALGMSSFAEYCAYVFESHDGEDEFVFMMDAVTTNKTDFFREPAHFEHLVRTILPDMITKRGTGLAQPLMIWSAGCSTGEEPYTLAMVLAEFTRHYPGIQFEYVILATDLSTRVLYIAQRGVYDEQRIQPIPSDLRRLYLLRSRERKRGLVRIIPELRARVRFRRLNLMEDNFGFREPMDIIFCRNVIIYFDRPTQERLINNFHRHLCPGGYIFMGHSETLNGLNVPFKQVAPTIYQK